MKVKRLIVLLLLMLSWRRISDALPENGGKTEKVGTIMGKAIDRYTQQTIPGVLVSILETGHKTITNELGEFLFKDIDAGSYVLKFEFPEFTPLIKTDVMVRPKRITVADGELTMAPVATEEITVNPGYFEAISHTTTHAPTFGSEEIRRAPGAGGDVSRILASLPSVTRLNDNANALAVRGGNPMENTFLVDNIEIPNINHFPFQGTSGGVMSLLNTDFIDHVTFHPGAFPVMYGGKLSSVMDISYREGNTHETDIQMDLNMSGLGIAAEGPLSSNISWLFSARRSYFDLVADFVNSSIIPSYGDIQGKISCRLSPRSNISILGVVGIDDNVFSREQCITDGNNYYGETHNREGAFGMNWFWAWSGKGYSETSLSYQFIRFEDDFFNTLTEQREFYNRSTEAAISFRNVNHYTFSRTHQTVFGIEAKRLITRMNYAMAGAMDPTGKPRESVESRENNHTEKTGGFIEYKYSPLTFLTLSISGRGDYFAFNRRFHFSPRISANVRLTRQTEIYGAAGVYFQEPPLRILFQNPANRLLKDPKAIHYSVGFASLLSENTRLSAEGYYKDYYNFPMDPSCPQLFIIDSGIDYREMYAGRPKLTDTGRARSWGIELIVQKKLKEKVYGMISGAFFRSQYQDMTGVWRNRNYDNRFIFSVEGGYKPGRSWEFSMRWLWAGGTPYTPFDLEASQRENAGIIDTMAINTQRTPTYHSLNLRVDKRFFFSGSNLVVYLSLWNAYNRENSAGYYWNTLTRQPDIIKQFGTLPVFGVEYEF